MMQGLLLLIFSTSCFSQSSAQAMLGVLEDNQGHYAGDSNYRAVRAVFQRKGAEWQPFRNDCEDQICLKESTSDYPRETTWTIAFDGKNLGQVTSRTPEDFGWYSSVGQQAITSKGAVPTIGTRSSQFGGYTEAIVYRPLVANSKPYYGDPDGWKPLAASPSLTAALQSGFRKKFPSLCHLSSSDERKLEPLVYHNKEVKILKSYESKSHWIVAQLYLDAVDCRDVEGGFELDDQWFVVDPLGSVRYLDSGLWLVDAGDYDNDGESELLFSINRENQGGYELFYHRFNKRAVFQFSFH